MAHAGNTAMNKVVCSITLIGGNEVGIIDAGKWDHRGHFFLDLHFQRRFKHSCPVHGFRKIQATDVPSTNNKVVWMYHWQNIVERNIHVSFGLRIGTELHGGAHNDGSIVIGIPWALACVPYESTTVSDDSSSYSRAVIAAPANEHNTDLWYSTIEFEVILGFPRRNGVVSGIILRDACSAVRVLG